MEEKEIEKLIQFHQDSLDMYRVQMNPAAQYLEEQTIKALKELQLVQKIAKSVPVNLENTKTLALGYLAKKLLGSFGFRI